MLLNSSAAIYELRRRSRYLGARLKRLLDLPAAAHTQLLTAAAYLLLVRIFLLFLPLKRVHYLLTGSLAPRRSGEGLVTQQAEQLSLAVSRAATVVPGASCLPQALALQSQLLKAGEDSRIHVGFIRRSAGEVSGHAWLEWRQRILIGGGDLSGFETIMTLEGTR